MMPSIVWYRNKYKKSKKDIGSKKITRREYIRK
jgi:hypothetical protein